MASLKNKLKGTNKNKEKKTNDPLKDYLIDEYFLQEENHKRREFKKINDKFTDEVDSIINLISKTKQEVIEYCKSIDERELNSNNDKTSIKKIDEIQKVTAGGNVLLNIGGEEFSVSLSCLKSKRNTLFFKQILRGQIKPGTTSYYDRDPTYFNIILSFLRTGQLNINNLSNDQKEDLLAEAIYYEISYIIEIMKNTGPSLEFLELYVTNPFTFQGKTIGNEFLPNLKKKSLDKGFLSNPNGEIIIKLNQEVTSGEIKVAGYNGNSQAWYITNGAGCTIYTSLDKIKWEKIINIPKEFGLDIISLKFPKIKFLYIKLSHTEYFGVGYLEVIMS